MKKKLVVEIEMESAAFEGDAALEASRLLFNLAETIRRDGMDSLDNQTIILMDVNGNAVGRCVIE